ncbi:T9SS type B sorting domain-containing protein [Flavobacterium sp. KACC 22763]|uniref:T9SS type B sorting domain-containing protein n=1 Tax=Flavobacterium sp. KACC 22763 TaxID=3025668 RepID=UPI0023670CA2|nr:T9SS type B sorting domain-containing protein [Flavobacterium sp. KACC 22763]WDF62472.1 T9SS type B sorting domain-containing protein [Flavobacterium sp. KACC 22763]
MHSKKTKLFLLLFLIFLVSFSTNAQNFKWAGQIKGIRYDYADYANKMELDSDGNSYIFGETESYLFDIDPTINGVEVIDNSNIQNFRGLYLIKMDKDGNYIWGKTFGNYKRGGEYTYGIKLDKDGNVNLLATISELNSTQNIVESYISIIKLKPNGDLISTKKILKNFPNGGSINPHSFDIDNQNNIFITGYLIGTISLDPLNPSLNLTATGIDNYILKINNSGNIEWIKTFDNNDGDIANSKVIIGKDGNIHLLNGQSLYKINPTDKSIIWERKFTNQSTDVFHITENNIILINHKNDYNATVDVDPSPSSTVNVLSNNYIIYLNLDGNFIDVKKFEKPFNGNINFYSVAEDYNGNLMFVGSFKDTVDFDPSSSVFNLTSISDYGEGFYLKFDANRNFVNTFKIGHETPQLSPYNNCAMFQIKNIKVRNNETYLSGDFMWTCDFDPSLTKQYTLRTINISTINRDGFILKLAECETGKPNGESDQSFCSLDSKISDLNPKSNDIKWYDSPTSTNPLLKTTLLIDGKTYFASQQNDNCPESTERLAVTAHLNVVPSLPSIINSAFCKNDNPSLGNIEMSGQNIRWYDTVFSAVPLSNSTLLENNRTYYASQTINCESDRIPVLVKIYDTPLPTGNNDQQFCIDEIATIENLNITGTDLKWYEAEVNGNILPETTLLQNGKYYVSQTLNNCESERLPITVKIQDTSIPIADSPQQFCIQKNAKISNIEINGQNIKWYESSTSTGKLSESTSLENGITYYASQTINTCESDRIPVTISVLEATAGDCIHLVNDLPFPKFFTPNGDGFNDTWTIDPDYLAPNSSIRIFDRYGKLIKELALNTSWNGTYLGNQLPTSDYWFTVTRINGTEYRGHFSLKR